MFYKGANKRNKQILQSIIANTRNNISKRSLAIIEKEIADFDLLDIENISIEQLQTHLSCLITGHSRLPYKISPEGVFRVRKNENTPEFKKVAEVWYPDWKKIDKKHHRLGRCNDAGESVFYCSTELATSIIESRPKLNDIVTLIDYTPNKIPLGAMINPIGVMFLQKLDGGFKTLFADHYKKKDDSIGTYKNNVRIDDFLNQKFHDQIEEGKEWKYKSSIAITNILFDGSFDGIVYPSISAKMTGVNFAFKPSFADRNFYITNGRMYKVIEASGKHYKIEVVKILESVDGTGKEKYTDAIITWRNIKSTDRELVSTIEF